MKDDHVAEVSPAYLTDGHSRENGNPVPVGYKQTEVGIVPEDWDVDSIGNLLSITTGKKNTQDRVDDGIHPFFVRSQSVERINSYSYDGEGVLTAGDGVGTGKIFHYINGKFDFHQRVYLMYNFDDRLNGYFFYIFFSNHFYDRIMSMTAKSSVDSVRREMIADMVMVVPPKIEQTAIANALSDIDALISELENLIAKKQSIKTATMQQLLTGRTRLPQFALRGDGSPKGFKQSELGEIPEDWRLTELDSLVSSVEAGVSVNSVEGKDIFPSGRNVLKTSCVNNGYFDGTEVKSIIPNDLRRAKCSLVKGSIIVSRMNTPALVGEVGYVSESSSTTFLPDRLWQMILRDNGSVSSRWLAYLLSFPEISRRIKESATGTSGSMKNISKSEFLSLVLPLPGQKEQTAIAIILSDMDDEVQLLEQRLNKTRQIKQGMMQELLTGRARLI